MSAALATPNVRVEPAAGALGAYVFGFDLATQLDDAGAKFLRSVMIQQHVVCFRQQNLTPAQHLSMTRVLGDFYIQPVVSGLDEYPQIIEVFGAHRSTESWHQDSPHSQRPPRYSILVARRIPAWGNDTQFANQHLAYERLSPGLQELLAGLRAVHKTLPIPVGDPAVSSRYRQYNRVEESAVHPVVRTHPDTGRKALYVNAMYTKHFEGMTEDESQPLLQYLYRHCGRVDFSFRHRWLPGDVLIWDNASVQHAVIGDMPDGTDRYLHRTTTIGEVPN